ncbi:MAG TPA: LLM class F420-dependent oxidoreductase [Acidimicrobiales bacterium]|nr:LLM class F420-dependent oxidoreductase [Acidimicrobiales bacterium]
MELRVFTEPQQGATYEQLLAVARVAEECGYGAFFRSDHFLRMGGGEPGPGPTESWVTLAGIARETSTIRLGTLVTSATFRLPGVLAITVAEVDAMSGGRVELGLGAGWFEQEHRAYGIPFPPLGERFERLAEQLELIEGLWQCEVGSTYSFEGRHYRIEESPGLPKPLQRPRPPVIVGGHGTKRTPALAARFADELNVAFASADDCRRLYDISDRACEEAGRDPGSLVRSATLVLCCGRDESEVERRAAAIGRAPDELRRHGAAGTVEEVVATLRRYGDAGASRIYLQLLDLSDLDHLRLVSEEVLPCVLEC